MSLKKNIIKNGVANGFQKLMRVAEQLVLVPFFISSWGAAYYGEWITLTTIPSALAFADFGFGSAAANTLVLRYASGDKQGASNAATNGLLMLICVVITSLFVGGGILAGLVYWGVLDKIQIPIKEAILSITFLMTGRIFDFFSQLFEGYYRSARKAALSIHLSTGYACVKLIVSVILLSTGFGIVELALSNLILSFFFNLFYAINAYSLLPLYRYSSEQINKHDLRLIAHKGLGYLFSPIWQALFFQGTTLAVRVTLGAEAVALFNTVRTVCRSAVQVLSLINGTVFPEIQFEIGAGHMDRARRVFRVAVGISTIVSISSVIVLALIGPWLYKYWTNNTLNVPISIWYCFLLGVILNSFWWTAGVVFRAMNKPGGLTVMGAIGAAVSVLLSYGLANYSGLIGASIGSIALEIIMAIYVLPTSCRMLQQPISKLPADILNDFSEVYQNLKNGLTLRIKGLS